MATNNSINANSTTPLPIVDGGTQVTSVTIAPTATAFAGWDANKNLSANNLIDAYTTTATAAGTTTLTVSSTYQQYFTGSTTQTVVLPVTSTLVLGQSFLIVNNSSGVVTVQSSGGNTVTAMAANTQTIVTCVLTSGTTAASWNSDYTLNTAGVASITGTANQVIASASTGGVTLSLPQSIATSSAVQFASVEFSGNNGLIDSNGKEMLTLNPSGASSVNNIQIGNSATTNPVGLTAVGTDTNILFQINGKGNLGGAIAGSTAGTNAVAGYVGEVITSVVTTQAISNNTLTNVTSISLTAGDWDVWGNIFTNPAGTTTQQAVAGGISTTTATLPSNQYLALGAYTAGNSGGGAVPFTRINVSSTTTVYLVAVVVYSVSTLTINGTLTARRAR